MGQLATAFLVPYGIKAKSEAAIKVEIDAFALTAVTRIEDFGKYAWLIA